MKPKDLLDDLETGDRTMEHLQEKPAADNSVDNLYQYVAMQNDAMRMALANTISDFQGLAGAQQLGYHQVATSPGLQATPQGVQVTRTLTGTIRDVYGW